MLTRLWGWMGSSPGYWGRCTSAHWATYYHLSSALVNWRGPRCLEGSKGDPQLQEDRGSGELQACETELGNPKCLLPTLKMLCFYKPIISCRHLWFRKKFVLFKRTSLNISYPYMKVKVSQEVPSRHWLEYDWFYQI